MSKPLFPRSLSDPNNSDDDISPPHSPTATVTPRLSAITQTIGRQLNNVASFLAPPPLQPYSPTPPPQSDDTGDVSPSYTSTSSYTGIKNDLAEISGSFKTGLSLLSSNTAVSEISKFASNLLQFDKGDDRENTIPVGITDDVINFVLDISTRPKCWVDFHSSLQHKDFNMSQVQKDHVSAIQQLVPNLTSLRHEIDSSMSEERFWMIYFILLLTQLNDGDYMLLSTPEIVQISEAHQQKPRNKKNTKQKEPENTSFSAKGTHVNESHFKAVKDKSHENDISFSDLEDEDNDLSGRLSGARQTQSGSRVSSGSETGEWVRVPERKSSQSRHYSESEESSDWHAVGDGDL